jgi:hypothetical protein
MPAFVSPGQQAEIASKALAPKTVRKADNSIAYNTILSGARRRPNGRMPVEDHKAVGRLLKSVMIGTRERAGVHKRVDAIRCELDDWVQCEYSRDELSDESSSTCTITSCRRTIRWRRCRRIAIGTSPA